MDTRSTDRTLGKLCWELLRIGAVGFGGPLVTLNLIKEALVTRLQWISEKEFLERMGMVKLLPGPVASLLAIALGRKFFGVGGSLLCLLCFITPAFTLLLLWALLENFLGTFLSVGLSDAFLWSFRLYIVGAILVAAYKLLRDSWKSLPYVMHWKFFLFGSIIVLAAVCSLRQIVETQILALTLLLGFAFYKLIPQRDRLHSFTVLAVFLLFFGASVIVFGTGYMIFPYIERELVQTGYLSREAFEAGILAGNLSPGPVIIASTYYGWKLAGLGGALAATLGIFAGPFILMNLIYGTLERLRSRAIVQHLSLCIVPAVVVVLLKFNWELFTSQRVEIFSLVTLLAYVVLVYRVPRFLWHLLAILLIAFLRSLSVSVS